MLPYSTDRFVALGKYNRAYEKLSAEKGYSVPSRKLLTSPASVGVDRAACPVFLSGSLPYPELPQHG
jgi:hypothetical protein